MFNLKGQHAAGDRATLDAISRSVAIIEFDPRGNILTANENFCGVMGYTLAELAGRHHRIFVDPDYAQSSDYADFWKKLGRGEFEAQAYRRIAKGGGGVWIQASYNPVFDRRGQVTRVVKIATNITEEKLKAQEAAARLDAISRVQAVIEFTPEGDIVTANANFLTTLGYQLSEITGKHHRIFVEPAYAQSAEYQQFWETLRRGEYVAASFKRIAKGGREVWIQASYNPILDVQGKVIKVVKFATDITDLTHIGKGLEQLAANDLERSIEQPFSPAFEKLRLDFNRAHENLKATVAGVVHGTSGINSGIQDIAAASDDLSRRTEQQAASLEQTAAALDEITATVKQATEKALHAQQLAVTAKEDAEQSAHIVQSAVGAMHGIANSSDQISQIIGVIDEIAFQTNLLALNAGVEAARAGDAGRGFAVVASEVRALAVRSAQAAKEIKALIQTSGAQVQEGVHFVGQAGDSLQRIMSQVADISRAIESVAAGAKEQSAGLTQVNTAINEMDRVTQQNAAMVEQATAASHSLKQETEQLASLTERFNLGQSAGAPGRGPALRVVNRR